jgi:hypothetical protein
VIWRLSRRVIRTVARAAAVAFIVGASSCGSASTAAVKHAEDSRAYQVVRDHEIVLVPIVQGGAAGWCLRNATAPRSPCAVAEAFDGPILVEGCNASSPTTVEVYALTLKSVPEVSLGARRSIPTRVEPGLPRGLRAAFAELRYSSQPDLTQCPRFTARDASGAPIVSARAPRGPLGVLARGVVQWRRRAPDQGHLPNGVCEVGPVDVAELSATSGAVMKQVRPVQGLFGHAFASCASTEYVSGNGLSLTAAVLLDASKPGSAPGLLPGMRPIPGNPGIYRSPGPGAELVARRVRGAWLVVQEAGTGLAEAVRLLQQLHVNGSHIRAHLR